MLGNAFGEFVAPCLFDVFSRNYGLDFELNCYTNANFSAQFWTSYSDLKGL